MDRRGMGSWWVLGWVGVWGACVFPGVSHAGDVRACLIQAPSATSAWIETADYTGTIDGDVVRFTGRYVIRTLDAKGGQVFLQLPGATVTSLEVVKRSGDANILPRGDGYLVVMTRRGTTELEVRFAHLLVRDAQQEGVQFQLPQARASTVTMILPHAEVELRPEDQLYVDQQPAGQGKVRLVAHRGTASAIDLRWRPRATAQPPVAPVVHGEAQTLVTIDEAAIKVLAILRYRATQGQTTQLRVRVPSSLAILALRGSGIADQQIADDGAHKTLTVQLSAPLRDGEYALILEGETPLDRAADGAAIPAIEMLGTKQERGVIAVAAEGSVELAAASATGGTRIDVRELPGTFAASAANAVLAYRYQQPGYGIAVRITRHVDHPVLTTVIEQADLLSVLAPQGERMTRALYAVVANRAQYLPVRLPEGATLWSCLVNGASKKPVEGDPGVILIPLGDAAAGVRVELVYFEQGGPLTSLGQMRLAGPRLSVPVTASTWSVYTPASMQWMRVGGNMERGAGNIAFAQDGWMPSAAAEMSSAVRYDAAPAALQAKVTRAASQEVRQLQTRSGSLNTAVERRAMGGVAQESVADELDAFAKLQDTGILPLKVRIPTAGRLHQFHRLMTSQDTVSLDVAYLYLPALGK